MSGSCLTSRKRLRNRHRKKNIAGDGKLSPAPKGIL